MPQGTIPLREIALRLGSLTGTKNPKRDVTGLWSLLRSGQLIAGLQIPGRSVKWLQLPTEYWMRVGSDEMRQIMYKNNRSDRKGTYKVHISRIPGPYLEAVIGGIDPTDAKQQVEALKAELKVALEFSGGSYEAVVTEQEWQRYLSALTSPNVQRNQKPLGNKQREGWKELSQIVGAYMFACGKSGTEPNFSELARRILADATSENPHKKFPKEDVLRELVSKSNDRAQNLLI